MTKVVVKKIIVTHPRTGTEKKMDATIYLPFKAAIIQSLKNSRGKIFSELTDDVTGIIKIKLPAFKGSIPWYTISVLLDLKTRGMVASFTRKGKKLNRLS